jgi:hypothetical protein
MYSATSYIDSISIVIVQNILGVTKTCRIKNDRRCVGCICDMLTFGIKSLLLKNNTQILLKNLRSK